MNLPTEEGNNLLIVRLPGAFHYRTLNRTSLNYWSEQIGTGKKQGIFYSKVII